MATLILLKKEVEAQTGQRLKITFAGGAEAHLLAAHLNEADIGVVLIPSRSFSMTWEGRRLYVSTQLIGIGAVDPHFFNAACAALLLLRTQLLGF